MKILIACEESQRVCCAFRAKGHEAYSCDIVDCSGGHPEWHIKQDVLPLLNGDCEFKTCDGVEHNIKGKWDMIIAFPPCTYLTTAGAVRLYTKSGINEERLKLGKEASKFFNSILFCECDKICVENPVPLKIFDLPNYSQIIQPYYFGDPYIKRTCLWLKNLKLLMPTKYLNKEDCQLWVNAGTKNKKTGLRRKNAGLVVNQKERSKTFYGVAQAMAEQWG